MINDPNELPSLALGQAIQLELIPRTRFNDFNGPRVAAFLLRHRHLWRAVILDRIGLCGATDLSRAHQVPRRSAQ